MRKKQIFDHLQEVEVATCQLMHSLNCHSVKVREVDQADYKQGHARYQEEANQDIIDSSVVLLRLSYFLHGRSHLEVIDLYQELLI